MSNNSILNEFSKDEHSKLIETLDKLNKTLSGFNINQNPINNFEKGGFEETNMTKFEELLKKYNKTAEDVTFEYEGLSDEELKQYSRQLLTKLNLSLFLNQLLKQKKRQAILSLI